MICRPCYRCHVTNDFLWWGLVTVYSYFPVSGLGMTVRSFPQPGWAQHLFCVRKVLYIYICDGIYIYYISICNLGGPVPCTFYSYLIFPMYVFEKMLIYREKKWFLKLKCVVFSIPLDSHWFVAFNITSMLYYIYMCILIEIFNRFVLFLK